MAKHQIAYSNFSHASSPAFPSGRVAARPILLLTLINGENRLTCYGIVDSGADYCVFPLSFALVLGLNPQTATQSDRSSGLGSYNIPTYFWPVNIDLAGITQFPVYAGFTEGLNHWGVGLLGQKGFFDRFSVCFILSQGIFELEL